MVINQGGTGTFTVASPISSGSGSLTKNGPGTLVLTGPNAYTGTTTVGGGVLQGTTATIPSGPVVVQGSGNVNYNQVTAGTLASVVSGNGSFTKSSRGLLTLTAPSTYTGATNITAGTLQLGSAGSTMSNVSAPAISPSG